MKYPGRFRKQLNGEPLWYSKVIDFDTSTVNEDKVNKVKSEFISKGYVSNLMHLIDKESIIDAWCSLQPYDPKHFRDLEDIQVDGQKYDIILRSPGIDGVMKHHFGSIDFEKYKLKGIVVPDEKLLENSAKLYYSMKKGKYRHDVNLLHHIPKPNGTFRNIGVACFKDKLIERAVTDIILNPVCEEIFMHCSYAYRDERNCKLAIEDIKQTIESSNINYIIEADIKGYFDNINHKKLIDMLKLLFKDKSFIKYVEQVLKAGYQDKETGAIHKCVRGTPQGGIISPILANLYLHYVLDSWIVEQETKGICKLVRYADDFIIMFNDIDDCKSIYNKLEKRFKKYNLTLAKEKTNIIYLDIEDFLFLGVEIKKNIEGKIELDANEKTIMKKQRYIEDSIYRKMKKEFFEYDTKGRELYFYADYIRWTNNILVGEYKYFISFGHFDPLNKLYKLYLEVYKMVKRYLKSAPNMDEEMLEILLEHIKDPVEMYLVKVCRRRR